MLTIRSRQMAVLSESSIARFVDITAAQLKLILPRHCEALGAEGLRKHVRFGIEKASSYGIISEPAIAGYIRLMFMFGREFDRKHDWALRVLQGGEEDKARAVLLTQAAEQFLKDAVLRGRP